jgi:hypothetical protein
MLLEAASAEVFFLVHLDLPIGCVPSKDKVILVLIKELRY